MMSPTPIPQDDDLGQDPILARAFAAAAQAPADGQDLLASQERAWQSVAQALGRGATQTQPVPLSDCADYRRHFAAALDGSLDAGSRLLMEDHLKGCADCRLAWRQARGLRPAAALTLAPVAAAAPSAAGRRWWPTRRAWSLAAALLLALGLSGLATGLIQPGRVLAQVQSWQRQLSQELARLRAELNALPRPELRRSSALAAQLPADTLVFVALPNLSGTMTQADALLRQRIQDSPVLRQWWEQHLGDARSQAEMDAVVKEIGRWGAHLGDEIIVGMRPGRPDAHGEGTVGAPVILAQLKDEAAFRAALAAHPTGPGAGDSAFPVIQLLPDATALKEAAAREAQREAQDHVMAGSRSDADPAGTAEADSAGHQDVALAWIQNRQLFLSPSAQALAAWQEPTSGSRFADSALFAELARAYEGGVNTLIGVDLERLFALEREAKTSAGQGAGDDVSEEADRPSGWEGARHLIVVERSGKEDVDLRAELSYRQKPEGSLAWLAAPGPVAALDYLSPDAHLVMAGVAQAPETLLAQLLSHQDAAPAQPGASVPGAPAPEAACPQAPAALEGLAAGAAGEFAWGLDGPVLPKPAWVLALKLKDEARFRAGLETILDCMAQARGSDGASVQRSQGSVGGRRVESLELLPGSGEGGQPLSLHFLVDDGYLVAASEPGVLDRALKTRSSGVNLRAASAFRKLLPAGSSAADFRASGLLYQNLAEVAQPLAQALGDRSKGALPPGQAPSPQQEQGQDGGQGAASAAALAQLPQGLMLVEALPDRLVIRGQAGAGLGDLLTGFGFLGRQAEQRPFPQSDL